MNKKSIIIFIIIVVIAILSWIFIFSKKNNENTSQNISIFPTNLSPNTKTPITDTLSSETLNTSISFQDNTQQGKLPGNSTVRSFLSSETIGLKEITYVIEEVKEIFITPSDTQTPTANSPEEIKKDIDLAEIDKQIFETLFPDYIIAFYTDLQQSYIDDGYLTDNYEKIEKFDSEEKIFAFVNTSINVAEEQGFISESDARKSRIGANQIWRNIFESEKMQLQKELIGSEFYKRIFANRLHYLHKSTSKKIISFFESVKKIGAKKVYAADCYRGGAAAPGGSNNYSVWCCNCGINCYGRHCEFVNDCGTRCNRENYGCLNGAAGGTKPAIWDSESDICGVG